MPRDNEINRKRNLKFLFRSIYNNGNLLNLIIPIKKNKKLLYNNLIKE